MRCADFFRECGDLFSVHTVDNLDLHSEMALLVRGRSGRHERPKAIECFSREADCSRWRVAIRRHAYGHPQGEYAPSLSPSLLRQLATTFADLRELQVGVRVMVTCLCVFMNDICDYEICRSCFYT